MSCQCKGIEDEFNARLARRELRSYQKRGARRTTRVLLELVAEAHPNPDSLLDIGGGVGAIQHELANSGVTKITNVDASTAYLDVAQKAAEVYAADIRCSYVQGDFVAVNDSIDSADVVTLDRVLCCYDDVDQLVRQSAAKAVRVYGLVYPKVSLLSRVAFKAINLMMKARRSCFRTFLHDSDRVEQLLADAGFGRFSIRKGLLWQVVVYRKTA